MIDEETARIIGEAIAPRWHWRPGCFVQRRPVGWVWPGARVYAVRCAEDVVWLACHPESDATATWHIGTDDAWPDFRDAATLGQLEETVNRMWGDQGPMCAAHLPFIVDGPAWTVVSTSSHQKPYMVGGWHPSKAEALASAWLEAAGDRPQPEEATP